MKNKDDILSALLLCSAYNYTCPECPYYNPELEDGCDSSSLLIDAAKLISKQSEIIEKYRKADGFLAVHGWKWE